MKLLLAPVTDVMQLHSHINVTRYTITLLEHLLVGCVDYENNFCGTHDNRTLDRFLIAIMLNQANVAKCDLYTTLSVYDIATTLVKCDVLKNVLAVAKLLKCSVPSLTWEGVL